MGRKWGWEGGGESGTRKEKEREQEGGLDQGGEKIYHSPAQEANKFTTGCAQGVHFKIVSCFALSSPLRNFSSSQSAFVKKKLRDSLHALT